LYITIAGTIGDVGVVPDYFDNMNLTENAAKIIFKFIDKNWLQKALSSKMLQQQFLTKTNKLAQPKLALHRIAKSCIAFPPSAEQHRIVAKVDELMALCDQLEQEQEDTDGIHQILVETVLEPMTKAADYDECIAAWQRISNHFDTLFATGQSIDHLKQTILQLAVMGRLVPQDPNDEPASVLLQKIAREKARLIKEGKIKKEKKLPEISEDEMPFELPEGWEWVNLSDLHAIVTDGDHQPPPKSESGIPFLVIGNLNTGNISFSNCKFVEKKYFKNLDWSRKPGNGDILYTVTGSYGIPIPVNSRAIACRNYLAKIFSR